MNSDKPRFFNFTDPIWGYALSGPQLEVEKVNPTWWRKLLGDKPVEVDYYTANGFSTPQPVKGDLLLVSAAHKKIGMFRVEEVRYIHDPHDMFYIERMIFEGYAEGDNLSEELKAFIDSDRRSSGEWDHLMFRGG